MIYLYARTSRDGSASHNDTISNLIGAPVKKKNYITPPSTDHARGFIVSMNEVHVKCSCAMKEANEVVGPHTTQESKDVHDELTKVRSIVTNFDISLFFEHLDTTSDTPSKIDRHHLSHW